MMVLFDEFGGDPSNVSIQSMPTGHICANAPADTILVLSCEDKMLQSVPPGMYGAAATAAIGKVFTEVSFASFGNANGTCGPVPKPFQKGSCDSPNTLAAIKKVYLSSYFIFILVPILYLSHKYLGLLVISFVM